MHSQVFRHSLAHTHTQSRARARSRYSALTRSGPLSSDSDRAPPRTALAAGVTPLRATRLLPASAETGRGGSAARPTAVSVAARGASRVLGPATSAAPRASVRRDTASAALLAPPPLRLLAEAGRGGARTASAAMLSEPARARERSAARRVLLRTRSLRRDPSKASSLASVSS